jgi:hypothetical protein
MKTIIPLILLLFCVGASAQSVQEKVAKFEDGKKYNVSYDKFKDVTSVRSPQRILKSLRKGWGTGLGWYVVMQFPGPELKADASYWLVFWGLDRGSNLWRDRDLIALVDDQRLILGRGVYDSRTGGRYSTQYFQYKLTPGDWEKISRASHVEFQIGDVEGRLDEDAYPILKNMASLSDK